MNIKIFGDTLSGLQKILFINKIECVKRLGISIDTFENWEKGRNLPNVGNSRTVKGVSIMKVAEAFEHQYQKRLTRGLLDRELLEGLLSGLGLPDNTKAYLDKYIMEPEFVKRLVESAYEYHSLCKNRIEFLWKKLIEVYSDECGNENKKNIRVLIGNRFVDVRSDAEITLGKLAEGIMEELLRRDLVDSIAGYIKHYSFKFTDKDKKSHFIRADENKYLKEIEDLGIENLELVERIGDTTVIISSDEYVEEVIYPFMERVLENDSSFSEEFAERFKIFKDNFTIGRISEYSDYVISSRVIGQTHALINLENGKYFITDLNSKNGTYVNGERLAPGERREIFNNDVIGLVNFKYMFIISEN